MRHRTIPNTARGFTLIETIAAVVILAVAIPPMIWAVTRAHEQRVTPVRLSTARWLAAERMEQIIADRHGDAGFANLVYLEETAVAEFPEYSRSVSISEHGPDLAGPGSGYKLVTVTVTFDDRGTSQAFALRTVLTEHDD